jgi:HD-like signal output (HDOD) protein
MCTPRLAAAEAKLPMAGSVFSKLSFQMADAHTTLEDVVETVQVDTVLAARVVLVANSPVYKRGDPVVSLSKAIANIGTQQTCQIVGVLVASRLFADDLPHYGLKSDALWNASITSSVAARLLAERIDGHPGESYTLALLRSVGRLLLQQVARDAAIPVKIPSTWDARAVRAWERSSFGIDASEATLRVLRLWSFSPAATDVFRRLHKRPFARSDEAVLHVANVLAVELGAGLDIEHGLWTPEPAALKSMELEMEDLHDIREETKAEVGKIRSALGHVSN